jgi:hypothetical protein
MAENVMQGTPQGVPQEPQGGSSFPAGDAEGEQFILSLVKLINGDEEILRILQEETGKEAPASVIIGAIASQILTMLFTKLYQETGGQEVSEQFAIEIIRVAVKELADIADGLGLETSVEDEQQAAKVAGDSLDEGMNRLYEGGGQQAPQGQPQAPEAVPQGVMQGQPQGQPGGAI